jgi:hypothetical protein
MCDGIARLSSETNHHARPSGPMKEKTMNHGLWKRTAGVLALATTLGLGASAARAGDFCLTYDVIGGTQAIVGKAFKVPGHGRCKPFMGLLGGGLSSLDVTGSACTASDGSHVRFALTALGAGGAPVFYHVDLPLPLGPAGSIGVYSAQFGQGFAQLPHGYPCNPSIVAIP